MTSMFGHFFHPSYRADPPGRFARGGKGVGLPRNFPGTHSLCDKRKPLTRTAVSSLFYWRAFAIRELNKEMRIGCRRSFACYMTHRLPTQPGERKKATAHMSVSPSASSGSDSPSSESVIPAVLGPFESCESASPSASGVSLLYAMR